MPKFVTITLQSRNNLLRFWLIAIIVASAIPIAFGFNSTAVAQSPTANLTIQSLGVTKTRESSTAVTYQATATVKNTGNADFSGVQRVDYQINGGDAQLTYIITSLPAGGLLSFTFRFDLQPGDHTVRLILGDAETSQTVSVAGADIGVDIAQHRIVTGSNVEFDIRITNSGGLTANNLTLTATWTNADSEVAELQKYDGDIPSLPPQGETTVTVPIQVSSGSYNFSFTVTTSTIDSDPTNNSTQSPLDVEFIDLRVHVLSTESLGWDGEGKSFMSIVVEVENAGVDASNTFYVGIECEDHLTTDCATSTQSDPIPASELSKIELQIWLPTGNTSTRIFAVEDEDTFRWGDSNAIDTAITVPPPPELAWTLVRISQPTVASYWSDGTANVELDITLANNGTDEPYTVTFECTHNDTVIADCGRDITGDFETNIHPTIAQPVLRLPQGETTIAIDYGTEEVKSTTAIVPERIVGVDREVWDCFSDTSNVYPGYEENEDDDSFQGIGCAGWRRDRIIKWPVGEAIQLWSHGNDLYLEILDEVLNYVGSLLNVTFETVETKDEARLTIHTGVAREDADFTGLEDCIDFGGCADTRFDEKGQITSSNIAIWITDIEDKKRRERYIRSATLHELLHALTFIGHRHQDRTSVMSYEALNYTTVDGMDLGLFNLIGNPLVKPDMTFEEVLRMIIFADELNDTPEPVELSAQALLRQAHSALMNAGSFGFRVNGDWLGCRGNHDFGPAQLQFANLRTHSALWQHFEDGTDRYYYIGNPSDWTASEWWLRRGRSWQDVGVDRISEATTFRAGLSSVLRILYYINVYADQSDYSVTSRNSNSVEVEVNLDQPNPQWSRDLDLRITMSIDPDNYRISEYELNWGFSPRNRNSCDEYFVRASSPVYGLEFTFPDTILAESTLLIQPEMPDTTALEAYVATNRDTGTMQLSLPQIGRN